MLWENWKTNDVGNKDCLVSVDCVDYPFQQVRIPDPDRPGKTTIDKALFTHEFHGPGPRYEIAVGLRSSDICSINR
jgi:hypothetical protein